MVNACTCLSSVDMKITKSSLHLPYSHLWSRRSSEKSSAAFFFSLDVGFLKIFWFQLKAVKIDSSSSILIRNT